MEIDLGTSSWQAEDLPGHSWQPVDLADIAAGLADGTLTRHAPTIGRRDDGQCLFYAGKVNGLAGASGAGKTWTALLTVAQVMADGNHVAYVDLEDDPIGIVGRLLDLGVSPADISDLFHYVQPIEGFEQRAQFLFSEALQRFQPALVVIDSTGEALSLEGANPNADELVADWFRRLPKMVARQGAAVLVLDHMTKADDGGLWPIGSQRKRAAIDGAQYVQSTVSAFDKERAGLSKIVAAKDRHGNYRAGSKVAELHVTPAAGRPSVALLAPASSSSEGDGGPWRPTGIMERLSRVLEDSSESLSFRQVVESVKGKSEHQRAALKLLQAEGFIEITQGARNSNLHRSLKPYRQAGDPGSDLFAGDAGHTQQPNECVSVSVSLHRDTGHTHSTVSGTQSGHGRDTVVWCTVCHDPVTISEPGQTTHPNCKAAA